MATSKESTKETIFDETILKCILYLKLISASPKIFNINVCRLVGSVIIIIMQCTIVYGLTGQITQPDNAIDFYSKCQITFIVASHLQIILMIITLLYKTDDICDLSKIMSEDFLTSSRCCQHVGILRKYRRLSIKLAYIFIFLMGASYVAWASFPLLLNMQHRNNKSVHGYVRRYENMINFQFPVTTAVFNDYYLLFYAIEIIITLYMTIVNIFYNIFFIVFGLAIIGQYEVIARAFENVSHDLKINENVDGNIVLISSKSQ